MTKDKEKNKNKTSLLKQIQKQKTKLKKLIEQRDNYERKHKKIPLKLKHKISQKKTRIRRMEKKLED
ncbi:MAG: hypothetical protein Q8K30_06345 [Candidatus Gracilibacteria bacterium]|nr:hypothetical protein [Candidatus Gracilibacteria bacterium]MDP2396195.1 hypothetical protein [bacterium]MDP3381334.1 hypothetical protein [bacterium]